MKQEKLNPINYYNLEAETSVIGSILLDPISLEKVVSYLHQDHFYNPVHKKIYSIIFDLYNNNLPIDTIVIIEKLNTENIKSTLLIDYINNVSTSANIEHYANLIIEKAKKRNIIEVCNNVINSCQTKDIDQVLQIAEKSFFDISNQSQAGDFRSLENLILDVYDHIEIISKQKKEITGISSGFESLDKITMGFQPNDLIIIGARPSMGKTAFVLNIAQHAVIKDNKKVAFFSLEMSAEQLTTRLISMTGNIDSYKLKTGQLQPSEWSDLVKSVAVLNKNSFYIDDTPNQTITAIRTKARRLQKENGLNLIIIDYLQLIQGHQKNNSNRQQEVSEISRLLKGLARELKVPVIALSQLSRSVELRQDKSPIMSDLRDSGGIEQDADLIAFLYRDEYYYEDTETPGIVDVIISKHRNGAIGEVKLGYKKEFNKFLELQK